MKKISMSKKRSLILNGSIILLIMITLTYFNTFMVAKNNYDRLRQLTTDITLINTQLQENHNKLVQLHYGDDTMQRMILTDALETQLKDSFIEATNIQKNNPIWFLSTGHIVVYDSVTQSYNVYQHSKNDTYTPISTIEGTSNYLISSLTPYIEGYAPLRFFVEVNDSYNSETGDLINSAVMYDSGIIGTDKSPDNQWILEVIQNSYRNDTTEEKVLLTNLTSESTTEIGTYRHCYRSPERTYFTIWNSTCDKIFYGNKIYDLHTGNTTVLDIDEYTLIDILDIDDIIIIFQKKVPNQTLDVADNIIIRFINWDGNELYRTSIDVKGNNVQWSDDVNIHPLNKSLDIWSIKLGTGVYVLDSRDDLFLNHVKNPFIDYTYYSQTLRSIINIEANNTSSIIHCTDIFNHTTRNIHTNINLDKYIHVHDNTKYLYFLNDAHQDKPPILYTVDYLNDIITSCPLDVSNLDYLNEYWYGHIINGQLKLSFEYLFD